MSPGLIDWLICGTYFAATVGLGLWFARRQKTTEEYFVGGRRLHWLAVGFSMFAATFSALSFVGLPREAAYQDYHLFLAILFIPFWVAPLVGWLFMPLYRRLGLISVYEYLERRFDWRLRRAGSFLFCLYLLGWMGSMLYAVGVILQVVLGLTDQQMVLAVIVVGVLTTFYTVVGGLEAVVWADAALGVILVGSMLAILTLAVGRIEGGAATVWTLGLEHGKFDMFDLHFDPTVKNNFYSAVAYGLFVYLAAHATAQTSVQRYQSMPSLAAVRRSLVVKGLTIAAGCLVFFVAGSVLFAFYHQPGRSESGFPSLQREDQLLTHFVMTELPFPGLTGLLLTGLFAAAMSSIDGGINSLTALVACDWLAERRLGVRASRGIGLVVGMAVIGAALVVPYVASNVFDIIIKIAGALLGPLLGIFLLGMFVPRANAPGAAFGLLGGLICLVIAIQTPVSFWWYGGLTCVTTMLVGVLASLPFAPPPADKVDGLLAWERRTAPAAAAEESLSVS